MLKVEINFPSSAFDDAWKTLLAALHTKYPTGIKSCRNFPRGNKGQAATSPLIL